MGLYKPIVVVGLDAYSAAMGPLVSAQGRLSHLGEVGVDLTADEGRAAAGQCAAVLLTLLDTHVGLRHVSAVVSITGHIQASRAFQEHAYVMDGASEIFASLLGDRGIGARSSIGVASLPMNAPIVVKVHVALEGRDA
jgi:enamine deaminase RidA (YjgF/YER057c/UK114 family)